MDATPITRGLWQGGAPPGGDTLRNAGFDVLVLCAEEFFPARVGATGVEVFYAPNDDSGPPPTANQIVRARLAAGVVVARLRQGKTVLVTCAKGLNRSGLVSALSLVLLGKTSKQAIDRIRERRPGALGNPYFVRVVEAFGREVDQQRIHHG